MSGLSSLYLLWHDILSTVMTFNKSNIRSIAWRMK